MRIVCKRLPATKETLVFLSPFMLKPHIQKYINPLWKTYYGIYDLFAQINSGGYRTYGAFELDKYDNSTRFLGFQLCVLRDDGDVETHAFWDRKVSALQCVKLVKDVSIKDYASDGIQVKCFVAYILENHRAARFLVSNMGFRDCGQIPWYKRVVDGKPFHAIEYRLETGA